MSGMMLDLMESGELSDFDMKRAIRHEDCIFDAIADEEEMRRIQAQKGGEINE
jgi:hypothetical protein